MSAVGDARKRLRDLSIPEGPGRWFTDEEISARDADVAAKALEDAADAIDRAARRLSGPSTLRAWWAIRQVRTRAAALRPGEGSDRG